MAGQEELCWEIFDQLNFSKNDINALYHAFCEIDVHNVGSIRPIELFTYFNIELGQFEEAMFSVFDEDKSGKLTFLEFVCSMWNLLSMPTNIMGSLCYLIIDPTGALRVHYSNIREVMELMHRKKVESASSLSVVMQELKNKYNTELSVQDVCKWANSNSSVLSPIVVMQLKFRKQLLGERYWNRATDDRSADSERSTVEWMRSFFESVRKKSADQRRIRKEIAASKNQKRETMSDAQKNIHDKQTLLLGSFNMLQQPSTRGDPSEIDENAQVSSSSKKKRRQPGSEGGSSSTTPSPQRVVPGSSSVGLGRDSSVKSKKTPSGKDANAEFASNTSNLPSSPKRPSSSRQSTTKNTFGEGSQQSRNSASSQLESNGRKSSTKSRG
jgi:Ca2+-binding EF-hand superfamily protein